MRHRKNGRKLSRTSAHRKALNRNLARSLILHGRIKTTITKAREVIPFASRLVTLAKDGSLAARRRAIKLMGEDDAVSKLFSEIGPKFADRPGGYLRMTKLPVGRLGDRAGQAFLEFVEEETVEEEEPSKKHRKQKKLSKKAKREQAKKERRRYDLEKKRAEAAKKEAEEVEEAAESAESEAAPEEEEKGVEADDSGESGEAREPENEES
jgi:large subunit ribosomal protein L17